MSDLLLVERRENVVEIVLNRPKKRNAINLEMFAALDEAIDSINRMDGVRAVVIHGAGAAFSAGIDVTTFMLLAEKYGSNWQQRMRRITDDFQAVLNHLERMEIPTIVAAHGYCLGMAMELALACDIRVSAENTLWGLPESRLGMIPDVGGTTRLTRIAGPARAKEVIFTGGQYDATLMEKWGAINYVVPEDQLMTKVDELVTEISKAAPLAVGMAKRVVDGSADIDRALQLEGWAQSQLFNTEDFMEGVQSFMMRRPPQWKGK
jgi:enoyl-CoA hydratase/carnithine racemase